MRFTTMAGRALVGGGLVLVLAAAPAGANPWDTNGDGTADFALVRKGAKWVFDTNLNGKRDLGEIAKRCKDGNLPNYAVVQRADGLHVVIGCNGRKPKEYLIRDNNGDGDTSDPGEVVLL